MFHTEPNSWVVLNLIKVLHPTTKGFSGQKLQEVLGRTEQLSTSQSRTPKSSVHEPKAECLNVLFGTLRLGLSQSGNHKSSMSDPRSERFLNPEHLPVPFRTLQLSSSTCRYWTVLYRTLHLDLSQSRNCENSMQNPGKHLAVLYVSSQNPDCSKSKIPEYGTSHLGFF